VRRPVQLYSRPGGRRKLKLPATTEWGSPRILSVVRRRGNWLAVLAPELKNGEMGWMDIAGVSRLDCVRWSLHVDLSRRALYVRRDGHTLRKFTVAIGAKNHPTPKGRFAVTDKLKVADKGSPYGCCVLALTGHQNKLPPDWPGGDRLAVHATTDLSSIGKPVSLGCMRSQPANVRWLIGTLPARHAGLHPLLISQKRAKQRSTGVKPPPFQALLDAHRTDVYRFLVASVGPTDAD